MHVQVSIKDFSEMKSKSSVEAIEYIFGVNCKDSLDVLSKLSQ